MSRSCHNATSWSPARQIRPDHSREPGDRLGRDRVALVRHRRRTLLARFEPLLHLAHLGALEVPELDRHQLARRRRPRRTPTGTRRGGRGRSPASPARPSARARHRRDASTSGGMFEYVPTAPLSFITATASRAARSRVRSRSTCSAHSATLAPNVVGSAWMPWVLPIITVSRSARASLDERAQQLVDGVDQQVGGVGHRPAQRRVDDVGRCQSVVDPRSLRLADRGLHDVDERRDVVVGHRLAFEHRVDERCVDRRGGLAAVRRPRPARRRWRVALRRQQLDLEPPCEPCHVGPHRVHLRCGVAGDHEPTPR